MLGERADFSEHGWLLGNKNKWKRSGETACSGIAEESDGFWEKAEQEQEQEQQEEEEEEED